MTYKTIFLLSAFFCSVSLFGQGNFKVSRPDITKIPTSIKYEGKIKDAIRWRDSLGENLVLITETGALPSKKSDGSDAALYAYHYFIQRDVAVPTWRVYDFIADCQVDLEAKFIKNTLQVTDLDSNGVAEVWLMYKTVCRGDVSPCDMKIIMYQGQQKFAMRGQNKVLIRTDDKGSKRYIGGDYKYDAAFGSGPKVFLDFARGLWEKHLMQVWGE